MKKYILIFCFFYSLFSCAPSQIEMLRGGAIENAVYRDTVSFNFDYNLPIITVEIDQVNYNFLLDTGAPSVISPELFVKLNLKKKLTSKIKDSNNISNSEIFTQIPQMKIGNLQYTNIGVYVIDLRKSFALKCLNVDGIIGANQMAKSYWKLDYENKWCVISNDLPKSEIENYEIVNFTPKNGQLTPLVDIFIDKIKFGNVVFDTGFNGAISLPNNKSLDSVFEKKVELYGVESVGIYGLGTTKTFVEVLLPFVKLDSLVLSKQSVTFSDDPSMVIGNEVFKNYSIIFDWNLQKMYFKKNANLRSKKTSEFISFGFIKNGDKIEVVKLIKNSEAEKKGLLIGDEVLTINDVIFKNIKDNQFCDFFYFGLKEFKLGDIINVKVLRNNEELKFTLTKENYFN